ncbi:MAG: 50S ribosomal protein L24 [Bacteroidia bacterium]|nr:50S ribosomal protein L24 [Bacteroidia bacterium]
MHIKKGDTVMQIAGKIVDGQNTGKVLRVYPKTYRALVEGLNIISRHTKPNATFPNGGIIKKEAPIHISNLMLVVDGKSTRVGRKLNDNGKLQRYSVKSGELIK